MTVVPWAVAAAVALGGVIAAAWKASPPLPHERPYARAITGAGAYAVVALLAVAVAPGALR